MEAGRGFDGRWDGRAGAVMVVLMSLGAVELIRADSYQIQRCLNTGRYGAARAGRFGLGINCAVPVLKGYTSAEGYRAQELCESRGGRPGLPRH